MGSELNSGIDMPEPESEWVSLHDDLHEAIRRIDNLSVMLSRLIDSHNEVGENVAWLTANTQGLFQMFSNPQVMSQMMGQMMGGMPDATGQAKSGT